MEKKKVKLFSAIALVALALLVVGVTYAYFQNQYGSASNADVNVTTYTTDVLTFSTGDDINLEADQTTFGKDKGSVSGATYASALLTANNKTNKAVEHYYLYLNIENNTFTYSINENTPELILTVIGPDGNEVTNIEGLTHTSVTDGKNQVITGFDVTTKDEVIAIANNREITASPSKEEQYTIKLTFVNYNSNQNGNAGAGFSAKVMIQKNKVVQTVANICKSGQSLSSCIVAMNGIDETLYHHNASLTNGAGDNSYRFAGASESVKNFVCFGTNTTPCPTDNLYRIIGVFGDQVKLIKYDYANSNLLGTDGDYSTFTASKSNNSTYKGELTTINTYYWNNSTRNNTWSESNLNKVNLNTNYLNKIGTTWSNMIENTTWKVSGHTSNSVTPSAMYTAEITNSSKTYGPSDGVSKIGLMYASDYGFAAAPSAWTSNMISYASIASVNWMYMGYYEWTISRIANNSEFVFPVDNDGSVNANTGLINLKEGVRPSFNLLSSITYVSGSGSANDPILIN